MTVIDTSTASTATAYSNQRKVDRTSNGVLWAIYNPYGSGTGSQGEAKIDYSTDGGATWNHPSSGWSIPNGSGITTNNYTRNFSLFIDVDDYAHLVFKDNGDGYIYYRRGTPNAARTAWTWSSATQCGADSLMNYPDIVAHREGTGWVAHVVVSYNNGSTVDYVRHYRIDITSGGTISTPNMTYIGGTYGNAVHKYPSIDFNHTGDGKTVAGGTPHLYAAWSAGAAGAGKGIRFKKATYSGGSWTWGTEREIDSTRYNNGGGYWLNCLFDGTRVIIGGQVYTGTAGGVDLVVHERDAADTTTTTRVEETGVSSGAGSALNYGSLSYDGDGNLFLFGHQSGSPNILVYRKWDRGSGSTSAESAVTIDPDTGAPYVSAKRGYSDGKIEFVYTDGTASPYDVTYGGLSLNAPPNAPTLTNPVGGATIDRTATNRFAWTFADPDAGDTQSAYDLEVRETTGGTVVVDTTGATPNAYHDLPGGTLTAGAHEWRVRTYDAAGEVGPWSSWEPFVAATPPSAPTITDPTAGQTIGSEDYTVAWSTPEQDAYQLRRVADDAGTPDTATVYSDTGTVQASGARSRTVTFDVNNRWEHVQVRTRVNGLWSTWVSVRVQVSYTPPATPTVSVQARPASGDVAVSWTNPTPAVGEPAVTSMDVYRTVAGGGEVRIATGLDPADGEYLDRTAPPRVQVSYRVRAYGDNGTTSYSGSDADTLTVSGLWLHPVNDPGAITHHRRNGEGGRRQRSREQAVNRYAGRTYPAVEYGEGVEDGMTVDLAVTSEAERDALYALEGRVVCARDHFGRAMFVTVDRIGEDAAGLYGWDMALDLTRVDHDEEV